MTRGKRPLLSSPSPPTSRHPPPSDGVIRTRAGVAVGGAALVSPAVCVEPVGVLVVGVVVEAGSVVTSVVVGGTAVVAVDVAVVAPVEVGTTVAAGSACPVAAAKPAARSAANNVRTPTRLCSKPARADPGNLTVHSIEAGPSRQQPKGPLLPNLDGLSKRVSLQHAGRHHPREWQ